MTLLSDHQLPEPAENAVFLAALPMSCVMSLAAVLILGAGSLLVLPFVAIAGGLAHGCGAAADALGLKRRPETPQTPPIARGHIPTTIPDMVDRPIESME